MRHISATRTHVPTEFFNNRRDARLAEEARGLIRKARDQIRASGDLIEVAPDHLMLHLASAAGFGSHDVPILRVMNGGRMINILLLPSRIWHREDDRRVLLALREEAAALGLRCVLVTQRWLRGAGRSPTARLIGRCAEIELSAAQHNSVLDHVRFDNRATVGSAAASIEGHEDPIGAVFSLVCSGDLIVDRSLPLGSDSWLRLVRPTLH